jgi:hypothetical protein
VHTVAQVAAAGARAGAEVRLSLGGNLTWVALPDGDALVAFGDELRAIDVRGVALRGVDPRAALLGHAGGGVFGARVRAALDPDDRFLEF